MRVVLAALLLSQIGVAQEPYSYTYLPDHKRDPFANQTVVSQPVADCERTLCKFALDDLRLVGIVGDGPSSVAMFEQPNGTGLVARRNSQIGTRGGRISNIARDCVTVTEHFVGSDGRKQQGSVRVCLTTPGLNVQELGKDRLMPIP